MEFKTRIKHKIDTNSNWESENPVILNGEIILVTINNEIRIKIGDGESSYSELPFIDYNIRSLLANKVEKEEGKQLTTNDYSDADKEKLSKAIAIEDLETHRLIEAMLTSDSALKWNGDVTSKPIVGDSANGAYVKVISDVPAITSGANYVVALRIREGYSTVDYYDTMQLTINNKVCALGSFGFLVTEANAVYNDLTFPEPGVYLFYLYNRAKFVESLFISACSFTDYKNQNMKDYVNTQLNEFIVSKKYEFAVSTDWVGAAAPYAQTISLIGIKSNNKCIGDVLYSSDYETALLEESEYSKIFDIEIYDNYIIVFAKEITTIPLNMQIIAIN